MDRRIEKTLKQSEGNEYKRLLGLSPPTFDKPLGPPFRANPTSPATKANLTFDNISELSSPGRGSDSYSASRRSSGSTVLSTAPSLAPFPIPPWHIFQRGMSLYDYDYTLPCEFQMLGCNIIFHNQRYEDWINHTLSHFFEHGPPSKSVCTFCDDPEAYIQDIHDPYRSWRARLVHMGRHHQETGGSLGLRPDYFLLEHLGRCGLIDDGDYEHNMSYTERNEQQSCDKLVDNDFQTPEKKDRERRNAMPVDERHDMRKEERQRKQDQDKRRSGRTHKPSGKSIEVYQKARS